jgi:exosortase/archaeosortase family protein
MLLNLFRNFPARVKTWNIPRLIQIWIFALIMLVFQLLWEQFENELNAVPFFLILSERIGNILLTVTPEIINPLIDQDIVRSGISLILPSGFYVSYFFYLSGIKQLCLVVVLFLLVPGPWMKKIWYIPLNILVILFFVFIRFLMLTMHCLVYPEHLHLIQDLLFGPMFYFEILILWLAWVLIVAKTAKI